MIQLQTTNTKRVKLTIAADRVALKFPPAFSEDDKTPYIKISNKIVESVGTPIQTLRGFFIEKERVTEKFGNSVSGILLSNASKTFYLKFDFNGNQVENNGR